MRNESENQSYNTNTGLPALSKTGYNFFSGGGSLTGGNASPEIDVDRRMSK